MRTRDGSDFVSISACHYDRMKKRLEDPEKLNKFLMPPGNLWKAECKELNKNLRKAKTEADCQQVYSNPSSAPFTSSSKNKFANNPFLHYRISKNYGILVKKFATLNVRNVLAAHIYASFDTCSKFAHFYISEVCPFTMFYIKYSAA